MPASKNASIEIEWLSDADVATQGEPNFSELSFLCQKSGDASSSSRKPERQVCASRQAPRGRKSLPFLPVC
ncbi:MAG TPA: hypothetical protein DDW52_24395 [Planctomycetaceae bacterium]|nr:hypothetical protein [Planctomycetaceae bacterium]